MREDERDLTGIRSDGCACGGECTTGSDSDRVPLGAADIDHATVEFRIEDMDCASCMATIRSGLNRQPGFVDMTGSPVSRRVTVAFNARLTDAESLRRAITDLGYRAHPADGVVPENVRIWRSKRALLTYTAGVFFIGGLLVRLLGGHGLASHTSGFGTPPGIDGTLFLIAAVIGAWNFVPKAIGALRAGVLDMHVLMALAVVGAAAIGEYMEAGAIAFLFSLAELLEGFAVERANASVRSLMKLSPEIAIVVRDGREVQVRAVDVEAGEQVLVRPGERIPVDGRILEGTSAVNESAITGEAMPVDRGPGDQVYAGTIVHEGFLEILSERGAEDSTIARMIDLVEEAESRRAPSERFVEQFARIYTPTVTIAAALVILVPVLLFGASFETWLLRGLTLLVIACPCALVISTPVSVVSAVTSAARNGVLIKGGESLERMGEVSVMAFDKSGTLTHGRADLVDVIPLGRMSADEALSIAAAAESRSEHPLGRAIVRAARERGISYEGARIDRFEALPGLGVRATVDGVPFVVGRPVRQEDLLVPGPLRDLAERGQTAVLLARVVGDGPEGVGPDSAGPVEAGDLRPIALLALDDGPRSTARGLFEELRHEGIEQLVVLSGDHERAVRVVGEAVGADEIRAGLDPGEKVDAVKELESDHGPVAMVGDGVNDAPALAAATVGIALGAAASDAALETADIALMGDDLGRLPYVVRLARQSRRVIRQNIGVAILLKTVLAVGVPLGAVSLIVAVLVGDMGASLAVTANALRLARVSPEG
jgi:Cd2+/Zn2+-exporting ATPase